MAYNKVHFEKLTKGVGLIAMEWSYIEFVLDEIIVSLSGIEDRAISATFAAGSDLRNKINTTKALATIRKQDKEWMKQLNIILDKIGNEYRIKRNAFIHSLWHGNREGMTLRMKRVRFLKVQSFSPLTISTEDRTKVRPRDLVKFVRQLKDASSGLELLFSFSGIWKEKAEGLTPISYKQYLRLLASESRLRQRRRKRKRPQKSSAG